MVMYIMGVDMGMPEKTDHRKYEDWVLTSTHNGVQYNLYGDWRDNYALLCIEDYRVVVIGKTHNIEDVIKSAKEHIEGVYIDANIVN